MLTLLSPERTLALLVNADEFHPCKKKFKDFEAVEINKDYADLVNSVQRNTVCNTAYY